MIVFNATDSSAAGGKKRRKPKRKNAELDRHEEVKTKKKSKGSEDSGGKGSPSPRTKHEKINSYSNRKETIITDERFSSANTDPRFRTMPKKWSKVPVDDRFTKMFKGKHFAASSAPVDKRGRRRKGNTGSNTLRHYYEHEQQPELEAQADETSSGSGSGSGSDEDESMDIETSSSNDDANGVGFSGDSDTQASSSDDDTKVTEEEENDDDDDKCDITQYVMANHKDTPTSELDTHRLAVVNMDWNYIKASDLYLVMNSFLPKGGQILSVAIYPSEFGLQRMQYESVHGPSWVFDDNGESSGDESNEISNEKLRSYELSKLRYYYAVVVCDSSVTANHLYRVLDGTEFLNTSNVFDLRFIPDSMEFKHPPRDLATEAPTKYKEPDFETRALQNIEVKLTWDEDEPERKKLLRRNFNLEEIDELAKYVASTDEESDGNSSSEVECRDNAEGRVESKYACQKQAAREKLRALVEPGDDSDANDSDKNDREITYHPGREDFYKQILEKKDKESESVWDAVLRKKREKAARKKRAKFSTDDAQIDYDVEVHDPVQPDGFFESHVSKRSVEDSSKGKSKSRSRKKEPSPDNVKEQEVSKAELELLFLDTEGTSQGPKGYNFKAKRSRGKKEPLDVDKLPKVDVSNDPRFAALFSSHLYALDPTDPQFKRSAAYARERLKNQKTGNTERASNEQIQQDHDMVPRKDSDLHAPETSIDTENLELSSMVQSLKRKMGAMKK